MQTHILTARYGAPMMVRQRSGLIVEVTDGVHLDYRGNLFYDLAKISAIRLAYAMAADLRNRQGRCARTDARLSQIGSDARRVRCDRSELARRNCTESGFRRVGNASLCRARGRRAGGGSKRSGQGRKSLRQLDARARVRVPRFGRPPAGLGRAFRGPGECDSRSRRSARPLRESAGVVPLRTDSRRSEQDRGGRSHRRRTCAGRARRSFADQRCIAWKIMGPASAIISPRISFSGLLGIESFSVIDFITVR